jgi:hypothetical protein
LFPVRSPRMHSFQVAVAERVSCFEEPSIQDIDSLNDLD